jgi:hypothetical protein
MDCLLTEEGKVQKKQHSILGIASCVIFLIQWVGFFVITERPYSDDLTSSFLYASCALIIFGAILGVLSFLERNTNKVFGFLSLFVLGLPYACVVAWSIGTLAGFHGM